MLYRDAKLQLVVQIVKYLVSCETAQIYICRTTTRLSCCQGEKVLKDVKIIARLNILRAAPIVCERRGTTETHGAWMRRGLSGTACHAQEHADHRSRTHLQPSRCSSLFLPSWFYFFLCAWIPGPSTVYEGVCVANKNPTMPTMSCPCPMCFGCQLVQ